MKNSKWLVFVVGLSAATPSFAVEYTLDLKATEQQASRMLRGIETIESKKERSSLLVREAAGPTEPRAVFKILVQNTGDRPFNFGPENIRLRLTDGSFVNMVTRRQMVAEEAKRAKNKRMLAGLAAGLRGAAAARAGDYDGTAFVSTPRNGTAIVSYSGTNNAASARAMADADAQTLRERSMLDTQFADRMMRLDSVVQTTTLDPGMEFGGQIHFSGPKSMERVKEPYPVTLEITIGDEVHLIGGTLQRQ